MLLVPEYFKLSCTAVEIFVGTLHTHSETFIQCCSPVIRDDGIIWFPEKVKYVNDLAGAGARGVFRGLDYSKQVDYIDNLLITEKKSFMLATRRLDQLTALKNILGDKVVTCSLTHDSRMTRIMAYDYIRNAKFYSKFWDMKEFDCHTIDTLANTIPQTFNYSTDYQFDLIDVYDKDKLASFLKQSFDQDFTDGKLALWNEWRDKTPHWSEV